MNFENYINVVEHFLQKFDVFFSKIIAFYNHKNPHFYNLFIEFV